MWKKNFQRFFGRICPKSMSAKYCRKIRNSPVRVDIEVLGQYWHHPPGAPDIQTLIIVMILWWLWYNEVVLSPAPDIQAIRWGCLWFTMFAGAQRLALTQTHCRLLAGGLVGGGTWQRQSPWTRSLMTIELVQVLQYLNRNPENLWTQAILEPWWSFNLDTTHHRRSWAGTNSFATGAVIGRSSALVLMSSWSIMKCLNIWY